VQHTRRHQKQTHQPSNAKILWSPPETPTMVKNPGCSHHAQILAEIYTSAWKPRADHQETAQPWGAAEAPETDGEQGWMARVQQKITEARRSSLQRSDSDKKKKKKKKLLMEFTGAIPNIDKKKIYNSKILYYV
jgi:predicted unusual protein kinase regulating ubiquinone biosynthesis (AarF/ABC1/UbiB family)